MNYKVTFRKSVLDATMTAYVEAKVFGRGCRDG